MSNEQIAQQELDRCKNGVTVPTDIGPVYISGAHYFYLNYHTINGNRPKYREIDAERFRRLSA